MRLTCYPLAPNVPPLVPASPERGWMEAGERRAYRCLPLSIANATGWELRCPVSFRAFWNGGAALGDIRFELIGVNAPMPNFVSSHFGLGIITFAVGYLFQTDPGWALWVRGNPNHVKDGVQALDAVVETDWLPFTFTMNWKFTRPGIVEFHKDEPFCFIMPFPHLQVDAIEPEIRLLKDNPALEAEHIAWAKSRREFNQSLKTRRPPTSAQAGDTKPGQPWQRFYHQGKSATGAPAPETHVSRRKLKHPVDRRESVKT